MPIDILELWDFAKPELSEERFRAALGDASPEEALILQTQIARTYGLRGDFNRARRILADIAPQIENAGAEAQARYHLELGRTLASTAHPAESQTDEARERARSEYTRAFELARAAGLHYLAIDALHMMTVVDTAPEQQLEWDRKAVAFMQASSHPQARKWEASLHNNTGYALHGLGRYEEALREFKLALAAREREGKPADIRVAWWMIAWTLRSMRRHDEALQIQLRLEQECDAAGEPDPYVFEELELLYRSQNDTEKAGLYAARRKAVS